MKKYMREEKDGSTTYVYADSCGKDGLKAHNNKGPAITNRKQKVKDYYLYGVKLSKDEWEKKSKFSQYISNKIKNNNLIYKIIYFS